MAEQQKTFHQLMKPKIRNFADKMRERLTLQGAPDHVVVEWDRMIKKTHDSDTVFYVLVRDKICSKWLRKTAGEYWVDLEAMEDDKKDTIGKMGGLANVFSTGEEERRWYECANWELDPQGKEVVNAYFSMFGDLYVNCYDTEGIKIPEV